MAEFPEVLIVTGKFDISTDYVVSKLLKKNANYLRLNTEDLPAYAINLDPILPRLDIRSADRNWVFDSNTLKAIYFRRPVFLREFGRARSKWERFLQPQWNAFERSLAVFQEPLWMNHPGATYCAEIKPLQLATAASVGFQIPHTLIGNDFNRIRKHSLNRIAMKPLDTVYIETDSEQTFAYTQFVDSNMIDSSAQSAPAIYQEPITSKLDIRVTVVGDSVYSAVITDEAGAGIAGDWRLLKSNCQFHPIQLPTAIARQSVQLTRKLGLNFGAIDLVLQKGRYLFIEINPTGEWSWLVESAKLPIDEAIANTLSR